MRLGYLVEVRHRLFADNIDWEFMPGSVSMVTPSKI
jgi:hypothetical protein